MSGEVITVRQEVADFDAALAFMVRTIERHRFTQPQASVMPWLLPPDAAHPEPWPGYRVVVAGRVDVAEPQAPLTAPWPPPTSEGAAA